MLHVERFGAAFFAAALGFVLLTAFCRRLFAAASKLFAAARKLGDINGKPVFFLALIFRFGGAAFLAVALRAVAVFLRTTLFFAGGICFFSPFVKKTKQL
jgi:hypothetical protein